MAVIDLTGSKRPPPYIKGVDIDGIKARNPDGEAAFSGTLAMTSEYYPPPVQPGPWLSVKITDFQSPKWGEDIWVSLAAEIDYLLDKGTDVVVACTGGHGRTGLAMSILAYLLGAVPKDEDPILWVRKVHCKNAVESESQIEYVYDILGLEDPGPQVVRPAKGGYSSSYPKSYASSAGYWEGTTDEKERGDYTTIWENLWTEFRSTFLEGGSNNE